MRKIKSKFKQILALLLAAVMLGSTLLAVYAEEAPTDPPPTEEAEAIVSIPEETEEETVPPSEEHPPEETSADTESELPAEVVTEPTTPEEQSLPEAEPDKADTPDTDDALTLELPEEPADQVPNIRDLLSEEELAEMTEEEIAWWQEQLLAGNIELLNVGSTQGSILLFNYTDNGNYTTYLNSQISVTYRPNGTDSAKTAYIKNMGWHFARYNNTPYPDSPLYCIEPYRDFGASTSGNKVDRDVTLTGSGSTQGSNVWYALPQARREAIGLVLLYSDQMWNHSVSVTNTPMSSNPNVPLRIATQMLIYEVVCGMRQDGTFARLSANECGTSGDVFYNAGAASVNGFADKYNTLVSNIQSAVTIPSFTGSSSAAAPTIALTGDTTTITDSNGVLSNWNFSDGNGVTFSKSGNKLTISQNGTITDSTVMKATRSIPSAANTTYNLWYMTGSSYQTTITLASASTGTVTAYFKLSPPPDPMGFLSIRKTTEDGKNLEGWQFAVYYDQVCTRKYSGPYTTFSDGTLSVADMNVGTFYVKELGHTDPAIHSLYYCASDNPQRVTIPSGGTGTVTFANKLNTGSIQIKKMTNTGNNLGGWTFRVTDNSGNSVGSFVTDEDGFATIGNLLPGIYTIEELGTEDPYWIGELAEHTVTVTAGSTQVDTWLNKDMGCAKFQKKTNTGENLGGWVIAIYSDASCSNQVDAVTTDETGQAALYLNPGTYYAKEIGDTMGRLESGFWVLDDSVQELPIRPHEDTEVTFSNKHCGGLDVVKAMEDGSSPEGWLFRIADAEGQEVPGSPFTTDALGVIHAGMLTPGVYTVEEIIPEDSIYSCTSENPQEVNVAPGETVALSFINAPLPGSIAIRKVNVIGSPLAEAEFLLEWSEDGVQWEPVSFCEDGKTKGGCSSADLINGCLTTDGEGCICWEGLQCNLYYRVREVKAPDGYILLPKPVYAEKLTPQEREVKLTVVNSRTFTLPQTGSNSFRILSALSALAVVVGLAASANALRKKRRK